MNENFTPEENAEFIRLLKKIQTNGYWVPTLDAWQEVMRTFSRWACELVITEFNEAGKPGILLSRYEGDGAPAHKGRFHIAGGFEHLPENIEDTCSRVAKAELGVDVALKEILDIYKWPAEVNPIGARILSVYTLCQPLSKIHTSEKQRFFTREEIQALGPEDMDPRHPHRLFADSYLRKLETR